MRGYLHTSMKDLKLDWSEILPSLALHYSNAQKYFFGSEIKIRVNKKLYPKFRVFEDDLRELGIPFRDYAYGVTQLLKKWVASKKMTYVPANTFLGEWALKQYLAVHKSKYVSIDNVDKDIDNELFYTEALIARAYISKRIDNKGSTITLADVIEEVKPSLSKKWVQIYESNSSKRERIVAMVMNMLRKQYHTPNARSYADIVRIKNG